VPNADEGYNICGMLLEDRPANPTTETGAVRLARELYSLQVFAKPLPGEHDDNFHLQAHDGRGFVLKVMHPAREQSFIDMQTRALQHLAEHLPERHLPRVMPTNAGRFFTPVSAADGSLRFVWLLTFVKGTVLADARPQSRDLLRSVGRLLGEIDQALTDFSHPAAMRELKWDSARPAWIREFIPHVSDGQRRKLVENFLTLFESQVVPVMPELRRGVIYGDANDYNVLVSEPWPQPREAIAVIDFGDMHHGITASEPAIAAAYAILGKRDPLPAAAAVISGYHGAYPLQEIELAVLYALIGMRLVVSVVNSAYRKTLKPNDAYVTVSEAPAWNALERLARIHPRFAHYTFRSACGFTAVPEAMGLRGQLESKSLEASILGTDIEKIDIKKIEPQKAEFHKIDLRTAPLYVFDLSPGSLFLGADPANSELPALTAAMFGEMQRRGVAVGIGRYDEARPLYASPQFRANDEAIGDQAMENNPTDERRTVHLGMDFFAAAGTRVCAPLDGVVHAFANNRGHLDYGPVVILEHKLEHKYDCAGHEASFFTLYGHLCEESLHDLKVGDRISNGQAFARIGSSDENGGWSPHLHFQVISDLLDLGTDFPGVARASEREVWTGLSPDPNLLLGIPAERFPLPEPAPAETLAQRRSSLAENLSISYQRPLKIVRGWKQFLYDETGRAFLDVYNNVPLVGHSHPRVVQAASAQLALLNTNTRYLHDKVNQYAERLTQRLPEPLRVCFFVNSGSEANELAVRLARTHTRREDVVVLEHAYHGHTTTLIDISPYKFDGPGGGGRKAWVHVAPLADDYRGPYRREDGDAGTKYAQHVAEILNQARAAERDIACFIAETLPSVGGQIVLPPGYLAEVYRHVRAAGAVCIADEVQVGFGRLGTHFWGFETQSVVPDIVVLGKPIGNGFPLAAVITTREIAASFANGMEFFSTFGGNPVACAAGLAVLDVLEQEGLQGNALRVGGYLKDRLRALQEIYSIIGDVRGSGLFLGVDLVLDRETRAPATDQADYIVNRLRECGVLAGTDGPHRNVLKLRPPLICSEGDADLFVSTLEAILGEDAAQPIVEKRPAAPGKKKIFG
jgi:4-aminobutyrate aminotransferase-like enzyme/Ser/Thr protein kinase RdoA (MazF antagonist)